MRKVYFCMAAISLAGCFANGCESDTQNSLRLKCEANANIIDKSVCETITDAQMKCYETMKDVSICKTITEQKMECYRNDKIDKHLCDSVVDEFGLACVASGGVLDENSTEICKCGGEPCKMLSICTKEGKCAVPVECKKGDVKCIDEDDVGVIYSCNENDNSWIKESCGENSCKYDDSSESSTMCGECHNNEINCFDNNSYKKCIGGKYEEQLNVCPGNKKCITVNGKSECENTDSCVENSDLCYNNVYGIGQSRQCVAQGRTDAKACEQLCLYEDSDYPKECDINRSDTNSVSRVSVSCKVKENYSCRNCDVGTIECTSMNGSRILKKCIDGSVYDADNCIPDTLTCIDKTDDMPIRLTYNDFNSNTCGDCLNGNVVCLKDKKININGEEMIKDVLSTCVNGQYVEEICDYGCSDENPELGCLCGDKYGDYRYKRRIGTDIYDYQVCRGGRWVLDDGQYLECREDKNNSDLLYIKLSPDAISHGTGLQSLGEITISKSSATVYKLLSSEYGSINEQKTDVIVSGCDIFDKAFLESEILFNKLSFDIVGVKDVVDYTVYACVDTIINIPETAINGSDIVAVLDHRHPYYISIHDQYQNGYHKVIDFYNTVDYEVRMPVYDDNNRVKSDDFKHVLHPINACNVSHTGIHAFNVEFSNNGNKLSDGVLNSLIAPLNYLNTDMSVYSTVEGDQFFLRTKRIGNDSFTCAYSINCSDYNRFTCTFDHLTKRTIYTYKKHLLADGYIHPFFNDEEIEHYCNTHSDCELKQDTKDWYNKYINCGCPNSSSSGCSCDNYPYFNAPQCSACKSDHPSNVYNCYRIRKCFNSSTVDDDTKQRINDSYYEQNICYDDLLVNTYNTLCFDFYNNKHEKQSVSFGRKNEPSASKYGTICPNGCNADYTDCAD